MKTLLLSLLLPALVLFAACGDDDEEDTTPTAGATRTVSATETPDEDEPTATPDPLATVCADNPDPGTDEVVQVDAPEAGDEVSSPLSVTGQIAAFEATFKITIYDVDGNVLGDLTGMSSEGQTLAPFAEEVSFAVTEETPACLWVYEASARDGSPIHVLQIPLLLAP